MEVSNEVKVKDEPIYDSQSISDTRKATTIINQQSIKQESEFIPINDSKRIRESISSDYQPNKRKRHLMNIKEEPNDIEIETSEEVEVKAEEKFSTKEESSIQTVSIAYLNEESSNNSQPKNPRIKVASDKIGNTCNICNKSFYKSGYLKIHQRIHTGERLFECDICQKRFTQSRLLERHKRIHSGEKPFKCDICENSFTRSDNLDTHKRIHTGEKPYKCDICNKNFTTSSNLVAHRRIHTGERHFVCEICKKTFTQLSGLIYHRKTHKRKHK